MNSNIIFLSVEYSIYCDESCHLPYDHLDVMILGAIWCPTVSREQIFKDIRQIKVQNGLPENRELKWHKISPAGITVYLDLVNYFFNNDNLRFKSIVVKNKSELDHDLFNQDHDMFYYKIYYQLLRRVLNRHFSFNIYIDVKDTLGGERIQVVKDRLCNEFDSGLIKKIQQVRAHEVELIQLSDLFIGAIGYAQRFPDASSAKSAVIKRIQEKIGFNLQELDSGIKEKFDFVVWNPWKTKLI